jgi:hypothetical protein
MKLFQIEEPEGAPLDPGAAGVAVGIDIGPAYVGRVAVAVGGNAEILPDADGSRTLVVAREGVEAKRIGTLLLGLRSRAEKQLARPVTHAVIAADKNDAIAIEDAVSAAGLAVLRFIGRAEAAALADDPAMEEAAVLGAAVCAEDLATKAP